MFNINFLRKKSAPSNNSVSIDNRQIRLVVGIGNPGDKYKNTYHNVGFLFIDSIIETAEGNDEGKKATWKSIKSFRYIKGKGAILAKTTSFMNESGRAVNSAINYFGVSPEEILIVHDDSDIPLGEYKISFGRGSAGHKGIESIIKTLGTKEFLRVRIGIRTDVRKAGKFVLEKMTEVHRDDLEKVFAEIQRKLFSPIAR